MHVDIEGDLDLRMGLRVESSSEVVGLVKACRQYIGVH